MNKNDLDAEITVGEYKHLLSLLRQCREGLLWKCDAVDLMPDDIAELINRINEVLDAV